MWGFVFLLQTLHTWCGAFREVAGLLVSIVLLVPAAIVCDADKKSLCVDGHGVAGVIRG